MLDVKKKLLGTRAPKHKLLFLVLSVLINARDGQRQINWRFYLYVVNVSWCCWCIYTWLGVRDGNATHKHLRIKLALYWPSRNLRDTNTRRRCRGECTK
jgi:hypothetical protein